jgi:hypothetical protein
MIHIFDKLPIIMEATYIHEDGENEAKLIYADILKDIYILKCQDNPWSWKSNKSTLEFYWKLKPD